MHDCALDIVKLLRKRAREQILKICIHCANERPQRGTGFFSYAWFGQRYAHTNYLTTPRTNMHAQKLRLRVCVGCCSSVFVYILYIQTMQWKHRRLNHMCVVCVHVHSSRSRDLTKAEHIYYMYMFIHIYRDNTSVRFDFSSFVPSGSADEAAAVLLAALSVHAL